MDFGPMMIFLILIFFLSLWARSCLKAFEKSKGNFTHWPLLSNIFIALKSASFLWDPTLLYP